MRSEPAASAGGMGARSFKRGDASARGTPAPKGGTRMNSRGPISQRPLSTTRSHSTAVPAVPVNSGSSPIVTYSNVPPIPSIAWCPNSQLPMSRVECCRVTSTAADLRSPRSTGNGRRTGSITPLTSPLTSPPIPVPPAVVCQSLVCTSPGIGSTAVCTSPGIGPTAVCTSPGIGPTATARHRSVDGLLLSPGRSQSGSVRLVHSCLEAEAPKAAIATGNSPSVAGLAPVSSSLQKNLDISEAADSRKLGLDLAAALLSAAQALHAEVQEHGANCGVDPQSKSSETALRMLQLSIEEQQRRQNATLVSITAHLEERMAHMERAVSGGLQSAAAATAQMQERSQYFTRVADVLEDAVREAVRTAMTVASIAQEVRQTDQVGSSDEQIEHLKLAHSAPLQVAATCERISRDLKATFPRSSVDVDPLIHRDGFGSERDPVAGQSPVVSRTTSFLADATNVKENSSSNGGGLPDEFVRRLELLSKELHGGLLHSAAKNSPPASLMLPEEPRGLGGRSFAFNAGGSSNGAAKGVGQVRVHQHTPQTSHQQLGVSASPEGRSGASIVLEGLSERGSGGKNSRPLADATPDSTTVAGDGLVQAMARLVGLNSPGP